MRRSVGIGVAVAVLAIAGPLGVRPAAAATSPRVILSSYGAPLTEAPYPGVEFAVAASGLAPDTSYTITSDVAGVASVSETTDSGGWLPWSGPLTIPASSTATAVTFTASSATQTVTSIAFPVLAAQLSVPFADESGMTGPWQPDLLLVGAWPGEQVQLSYPPSVTGPASYVVPAGGQGQGDALIPITLPVGALPNQLSITATDPYGRVATANVVTPVTTLQAGQTARVAADLLGGLDAWVEPFPSLMATAARGYTLNIQGDTLRIYHFDTQGPAVPIWSARLANYSEDAARPATLSMQTDGNLVVRDPVSGAAIWSSRTAGTGAGNIASLQDDGDLVVRTAQGVAVWSSQAGRIWPTTLASGGVMTSVMCLGATTGYRFCLQSDGNLVVRNASGAALWNSRTYGTGAQNRLIMQSDSNLVLYNAVGHALWSTHTYGHGPGSKLVMQTDGNLVIYSSTGHALWSSWYGRA